MAYLHEMAMNDAIKRLHLLGRSDRKRPHQMGEDVIGSLGGAMGMAMQKPVPTGPSEQEQAGQNMAKELAQRQANNELAGDMQFGGHYTQAGLEKADKEATLNGLDRIQGHQMIRGMMGSQPVQ